MFSLKQIVFLIVSMLAFLQSDMLFARSSGSLVLGVIASEQPENSVVLMKNLSTRKVGAFRNGDFLSKNAKLVDIQPGSILIEFRKKEFRFNIGQEIKLKQILKQLKLSRPKIVEKKITIEPKTVNIVTDQDISATLAGSLTTPYTPNGSIAGFKLRQVSANSALAEFGFLSGDVVTHINGIALTDSMIVVQELVALKRTKSGVLSFRRQGKLREIGLSER